MKTALFPGSFDPFTCGHADIVCRGLKLFDCLVIGVGDNMQKKKWISVEERVDALRRFYASESRIHVEAYSGLTVDFAHSRQIDFILRGVRSIKDYEYELGIADINQRLSGIETVVLFSAPHLASVSSSVVRELASFGHDIKNFLPQGLIYNIKNEISL